MWRDLQFAALALSLINRLSDADGGYFHSTRGKANWNFYLIYCYDGSYIIGRPLGGVEKVCHSPLYLWLAHTDIDIIHLTSGHNHFIKCAIMLFCTEGQFPQEQNKLSIVAGRRSERIALGTWAEDQSVLEDETITMVTAQTKKSDLKSEHLTES